MEPDMEPKVDLVVGQLGLEDTELKLLKSIIRLSQCRPQGGYVFNDANVENSDVVIVNTANLKALEAWMKISTLPQPPELLLYSLTPPADYQQLYLSRSFWHSKTIATLDQISKRRQESIWSTTTKVSHALASVSNEKLRALVVDDSPTVCTQLNIELKKFNIQADIAETEEDALKLIQVNDYDIFFLDVVLPGTDGYQLCKTIKKIPRFRSAKMIILTSKSSAFDRMKGVLAGCNNYLTKPVDYERFSKVISECTEKTASLSRV